MNNTNLSGALKGLCRPCLGHLDKLSTNGCIINSQLGRKKWFRCNYADISKHFKVKIIELVREGLEKDGMMKHKDLSSARTFSNTQ